MRADMLARFRAIARGEFGKGALCDDVTDGNGYARELAELRRLRPLLPNGDERESKTDQGVKRAARAPLDVAEIDERAGLAADRIAPVYLDAWARLNCQKPARVSEAEWRLALDDGGRFLDAWGADAATMKWTAGELFDAPREGRPGGLVWQLKDERVNALGEDRARLTDGRTIKRRT
jgi:hypothetical protein